MAAAAAASGLAPPRFRVVHRGSVLAVAALGFAALRIGGELDGAALLLAAAALAFSAWERRPRLAPGTWVAIQIAFLAWLAWGGLVGGRPLLTSFAALLIFVQVHRLVSRTGARDDLYTCFIAFGQLLLASVLTVDAAFLVVFVGFLVALVWAMLLTRLALATEREWCREHGEVAPVGRSAWDALAPLIRAPAFAAVSALTLILLLGTVALFFVLPRLNASFLSGSLLPPVHVSGFTESVGLGEIGIVQLSDEPVMRVRTFDVTGAPVPAGTTYWRGLALDRFDGRTWSLSDPSVTELGWVGGANSIGPPKDTPWSLRQEVALEPLDSRVLFHVADAAGIYGDFRGMEAAQTDGFYVPGVRRKRSYVVYSLPPAPDVDRLRSLDPRLSPDTLLTAYTQLPEDLAPRIDELAAEWTRGAATPVDAALLIRDRLRNDFTYSLAQPASAAADPLLAFLEEVQEGHCEYFASSMVVMLRTLGVPARIVNGFQGGEWNPIGEYWLVRQREAHSWVEVHFPEEGWIIFDPTPIVDGGIAGRARIRWLARLRAWADYGRVQWADVMLDYGAEDQAPAFWAAIGVLSGRRSLPLPFRRSERAAGAGDAGVPWRTLGALLALVAAAAALAWASAAARRRRTAAEDPPELRAARRLVARARTRWGRIAARGEEAVPESPGEGATVRAWAAWAADAGHAPEDATARLDRYYAARFGSAPADAALVDSLRGLATRR